MADRQHQWMKYLVIPVDILPSMGEEAFTAYTDPVRTNAAEKAALFGCAACSEPLSDETVNTPCPGADEELQKMLQAAEN